MLSVRPRMKAPGAISIVLPSSEMLGRGAWGPGGRFRASHKEEGADRGRASRACRPAGTRDSRPLRRPAATARSARRTAFQGFHGGGDRQVGLAGAGRPQRHGQRFGVYRFHQGPLVVAARADFLDVALVTVVGRSVVENDVVNTGAVDGVQLGSACGAFGHIRTPVLWSEERDRSPKTKTPPGERRRWRSVVWLQGEADRARGGRSTGEPNSVGGHVLERIKTLLQLPVKT